MRNSSIIMYTTEDGLTKIETTFDEDTVWLSLDQMAELFQRDKSTISRHIKNIFEEGELQRNSVVAKFATTASRLNQYVSGQVETIKKIHSLMTSDLKRHYTIEELSKQYLMNTTTLKSVFKAVYGMPIASYMKEYRMKSASNMLLHEDKSISEIAAAVGYKSQSKFTSAFRDIFQILPTAYQKQVSYTNALANA